MFDNDVVKQMGIVAAGYLVARAGLTALEKGAEFIINTMDKKKKKKED